MNGGREHNLSSIWGFWARGLVRLNLYHGSSPPYLSLRQLNLELLHLLPQLSDDPSVRVFIHHSMVDYSFGPVCVAKRGQSLLVVVCCWTHRSDHGCLTVTTKVVLRSRRHTVSLCEGFKIQQSTEPKVSLS